MGVGLGVGTLGIGIGVHASGGEEDGGEGANTIVGEAIGIAVEDGTDGGFEGLSLFFKSGLEVGSSEGLEHRDTSGECERIARERPCLIDIAERS